MNKILGCLHAHYSNIEYINNALASYDIEVIHFVDPGLTYLAGSNEKFKEAAAQNKVKEQIEWIAQCNVDAILITCTEYIALLQDEQLSISVPIIKIDEPYFGSICNVQQPQTILFTNPATVNGTMERLNRYAHNHQKSIDIEAIVINNTFELIMQGLKHEYNQEILKFLNNIVYKERVISVAQLSMVDASKEFERMTSKAIINPMDTLIPSIVNQLRMPRK
ncbi:hypothetical protein M3231_04445 [Neobacillus mesonae]|nr:hypothetical protein [Neobacillus mesonae]